MSFKPKAIQTAYNGYLFRSRLEARWAVFLDHIGSPWWYEKEGFEFDGERYLPDFWLPIPSTRFSEAGYWLEIKPVEPTEREKWLMEQLVLQTGHNAMLFAGNIGIGEFSYHKWALQDRESTKRLAYFFEKPTRDWPYHCCYLTVGNCQPGGRAYEFESAFRAARRARFEFGQTPESVHVR